MTKDSLNLDSMFSALVRLSGWYFVKHQGEWRPALYSRNQEQPWSFSPDEDAKRFHESEFEKVSDERLVCDSSGVVTGKKPVGVVHLTVDQVLELQSLTDMVEDGLKMLVRETAQQCLELVRSGQLKFWDKVFGLAGVSRETHNISVSMSEKLLTVYEIDKLDDDQAEESAG